MTLAAHKSDPLSKYADGVVAKANGKSWPLPLKATSIDIDIKGGIAFVRTTRAFSNAEDKAIEATMTFPVPGDAILTGLKATIDGREIVGAAKARKEARATYEKAMDDGKASVLHEELLRGIHMLSLGNLPPGKDASVVVTFAVPMGFAGPRPTLCIPTTVGEVYGRSPLAASDDIETGDVSLEADVTVNSDSGSVAIEGLSGNSGRLRLDGAIAVSLDGWKPLVLKGVSAHGAPVTVKLKPLETSDDDIDVTLLTDISGSTGDPLPGADVPTSKWTAMRNGYRSAAGGLRPGDRVRVFDFDNHATFRGEATGAAASALADLISKHRGGTEIGRAIDTVIKAHPGKDIVLVTDGRSHSLDVQALALKETRIHVVLVGPDALDAYVGHLAALTGGHCFVAEGINVADAIAAAFAACRAPVAHARFDGTAAMPVGLSLGRSGATIKASWGKPSKKEPDEVGRFAAGLAIAGMTEEAATEMAMAHGLCTHLTSLVLVDEAGERQVGIPATRKVPLMRSAFRSSMAPDIARMSFMASPMSMGSMRSGAAASDDTWMDAGERPSRLDIVDRIDMLDLKAMKPGQMVVVSGDDLVYAKAFYSGISHDEVKKLSVRQAMDLLVGAVDWDDLAGRSLPDEMAVLPRHVQLWVLQAAAEAQVIALARALGKPATLVAIGLLGGQAKGYRSAQRLSRKILGGAKDADVSDALRCLAA